MEVLTFGRLRHFGALDGWLLLLSIAGSAVYFLTRGLPPYPVGAVLKALGMAPLALLTWRVLGKAEGAAGAPIRDRHLLTAALALSCLGDVLLYLGARRYFLHALSAFLLAHVAYVVLFTRSWPRPLRPRRAQLALAGLVIVYGVGVTVWIEPRLGPLTVPVLLYGAAVTAMALAAILAGFVTPWIWIGALLFVLSDSLIAAALFRGAWRLAAVLVWPTYYLGQYGIAVGFLREKAGKCWTPRSTRRP